MSWDLPDGCTQADLDDAWGDGPTRAQREEARREYLEEERYRRFKEEELSCMRTRRQSGAPLESTSTHVSQLTSFLASVGISYGSDVTHCETGSLDIVS